MDNIKFEKIPALRVDLAQAGFRDFYVLIIRDKRVSPGYRDFYIAHNEIGTIVHMFGCNEASDGNAAEIAFVNGPKYIDKWRDCNNG